MYPGDTHTLFRQSIIITLVFMLFGVVYLMIMWGIHSHAILVGMTWGFVVGILGSLADVLFLNRVSRKWSFSRALIMRTVFYLTLVAGSVFFVAVQHIGAMTGKSFIAALSDEHTLDYLRQREYIRDLFFALVIILFVSFVRQTTRLLGRQVFWNYITGRYHHPSLEQRVIMFLDLTSSTMIAEKLGPQKFHAFLNDFFFDITPAITRHRGEIYQYVGDEVVITWQKEHGVSQTNCLKSFFQMQALIRYQKEKFENRYGFAPAFKAGFHFGDVVVGEIGDVKREIALHGDTMNTAARIRTACTEFQKDVLVSGDVLHQMKNTTGIVVESIGSLKLKGKEREVELFHITEAASSPAPVA